jgi:glycosyltransferase involved in cell wall biosynthesis
MLGRLNNFFYNKLHNRLVSRALARICYIFRVIFYIFKKIITKNEVVLLSYKKAYDFVNSTYQYPSSKYEINNQAKDQHLALSVIIPVYNVELYLTECIESVLNQNTKYNYEIIIINDGSTDNSKLILDNYLGKRNIRIISQKNKGLSAARNIGIDQSKGEFIMFVDSDDMVDKTIIEDLLNEAYENNRDIVACGYYNFDKNGKKKYVINAPVVLTKINRNKMLNYPGFACCKVYKRELFDNVRFPLNYWFEDTIIKFILLRICENFVYIPRALYKRRINETSITHVANTSVKAIDTYWIIEYLIDLSRELEMEDDEIFYSLIINQLGNILYSRTLHLEPELRKAIFVLSHHLVKRNKPKGKYKLPYSTSQVEKSLLEQNYAHWELAAKYL